MESLTITVDILSAWLMGDLGKLGKLESYVLRKVLRMLDRKGTAQDERGAWIAHLTSGLAMIYTGLESVPDLHVIVSVSDKRGRYRIPVRSTNLYSLLTNSPPKDTLAPVIITAQIPKP